MVGPWNHGAWGGGDGDALGKIKFGSPTARYFRKEIQAQWFAYQLMVANEVFRGRSRHRFDQPTPLPANEPVHYAIDLHGVNHCFLPGHRVMVQVQSSWFTLIDRNPQRFVPNIFEAADADFQTATQTIWRNSTYPSHLDLLIRIER